MINMPSTTIACKNCGHSFSGKYCNQCGEKVLGAHDRHFSHFIHEGFHFITHFEGTFFTTLRALFTRPGLLSVDYSDGRRKSYFKPLSFFLLLVILYLLFPLFQGLNMKLEFHLQHNLYGSYAQQKVNALLATKGMSMADISALFAQKSEKVSKFLLLLLLPLTALFFWPVSFRRRPLFFDQVLFATEVNIMYLLWGFLLLPLLLTVIVWSMTVFGGSGRIFNDDLITYLLYLPLCIYVAIAAKRFYRFSMVASIGFALYFYFVHQIVVQYFYKFILFTTVINQIH